MKMRAEEEREIVYFVTTTEWTPQFDWCARASVGQLQKDNLMVVVVVGC